MMLEMLMKLVWNAQPCVSVRNCVEYKQPHFIFRGLSVSSQPDNQDDSEKIKRQSDESAAVADKGICLSIYWRMCAARFSPVQ